jgi:hypothetical protein
MDIQTTIAEVIVAELKRQAEVSGKGLTVEAGEPGFLRLDGRINLDELIMVIRAPWRAAPDGRRHLDTSLRREPKRAPARERPSLR